eukprot:2222915-Prymnesium_polylepis.1
MCIRDRCARAGRLVIGRCNKDGCNEEGLWDGLCDGMAVGGWVYGQCMGSVWAVWVVWVCSPARRR